MGQRAAVAVLTQILMPEPEQARVSLAKYLAMIPHTDATKALVRLAIFSAEDTVRAAAIEGLRRRSERDYTEVILQGFNYPLPAVAKRSAEAWSSSIARTCWPISSTCSKGPTRVCQSPRNGTARM